MGLPYAVVTFIDDTSADPNEEVTSEVPSSWLTSDKKSCWWPTMKNVTMLISKQADPDPNDGKWKLCNVQFEAFFDTLEKARKKAESISSSSDENDVQNRGRGKRKRQINSPQMIDESSDNSQDLPLEKRRAFIPLPPDDIVHNHNNILIEDIPIIFEGLSNETHADATLSDLSFLQSVQPIRSPSYSSSKGMQISDSPSTFTKRIQNRDSPSTSTKGMQSRDSLSTSTSRAKSLLTPSSSRMQSYDSPNASFPNNTDSTPTEKNNEAMSLTPTSHSTNLLRRPTAQTTGMMQFFQDQTTSMKAFMTETSTKLLSSVAAVKVELGLINQRLEQLENRTNLPKSSIENLNHMTDLNALPFETTQQIEAFEKNLLDREDHPKLQSNLMHTLTRIGGNGMKDNTIRVLKKVFSNKFAIHASWLGLRNNFQISKLNITKIIKDAVAVKYPHTDKEFEELASEWFRQAGQRYKRELKAHSK